ncbi:HD domain-containing protein [Chitinimonas viridis]|uniref:HD domain-containing protein n=1 Tax=Chitinimonas viridis TaxID=664880 RepID=A0ABT8B4T8_9NEIS|nr:phosphonate degradation HD-domain oxygenase [Chitinimonas viridis]MDN3577143.1 HD domain-containing protein [Chitinimonas viridis]
MSLTIPTIASLFASHGSQLYGGEAISQAEHACQAAWLAEQAGEDDALIAACLLHDLGHLLFEQGEQDLAQGKDDLHQYRLLPFLRHWLPDEVVVPIGLHVDAKRYLCATEPGYQDRLSEASSLSLALQGGAMDVGAAARFAAQPHAGRAIALRRYDDAAKRVGWVVPDIDYFLPRLAALASE